MLMLRTCFFCLVSLLLTRSASAQQAIVTYAGNSGNETFYDVVQLSDQTFLVCGYATDLNWLPVGVPTTVLPATGINNGLGTSKYGYLLHLSSDLSQILHILHFPQGAVEDIRFIKTSNVPGEPTGNLYISGNTLDTEPNDGGYFIAKLDNNFVNGVPTTLSWVRRVWAEGYPKDYHPWDVNGNGEIYYILGQSHAYDWAAIYCLDASGERKVVENWRTHWKVAGGEWKGFPASAYPGGRDSLAYSGIVLKAWGRCDLRSWTQNDYDLTEPDGNGGWKKGRWPLDVLYDGPCDPNNPVTNSPGYTGYSLESCCPVYGGSSIVVDRRSGDLYIGMNMKSVGPTGSPDFEPAVIAMDPSGALRWWSRLYHEITPAGDTMVSIPDQYIDGLAIDYSTASGVNTLVVDARCHGNNTENLWEGNVIAANPSAQGFQNNFTGTNGNIHISWLGKLRLSDGVLLHSTYVAEYAEGTGALGAPLADPNLDGWPNPNSGWPDVNTTRLAKNNLKVTAAGWVCVTGLGRRTITTANAYQKMVKPGNGGLSCWNSFIRVYKNDLSAPLYSSLIVGQWDTLTQQGGGNTELFGIFKTEGGVVGVGRQQADGSGVPLGNDIPVTQVPSWGQSTPAGEAAILVFYPAGNLVNPLDNPGVTTGVADALSKSAFVYPNPTTGMVSISGVWAAQSITLMDHTGRLLGSCNWSETGNGLRVTLPEVVEGAYLLSVKSASGEHRFPFIIK